MPYTPINLGVTADDNTGDSLRAGGETINANFESIDDQLALKADTADLEAETAAREAAITSLEDALAGKADIGDTVDPLDVAPRFDATQTINITERRTLVTNTGGFVTLPFQLLDSGANVTTTATFDLPFFPENFIVHSASLMLHKRTVGSSGSVTLGFQIDQGATVIGGVSSGGVTATGKREGAIVATDRRITKEVATSVTLTISNTEVGGVAKGATLWLRGVWEA